MHTKCGLDKAVWFHQATAEICLHALDLVAWQVVYREPNVQLEYEYKLRMCIISGSAWNARTLLLRMFVLSTNIGNTCKGISKRPNIHQNGMSSCNSYRQTHSKRYHSSFSKMCFKQFSTSSGAKETQNIMGTSPFRIIHLLDKNVRADRLTTIQKIEDTYNFWWKLGFLVRYKEHQ